MQESTTEHQSVLAVVLQERLFQQGCGKAVCYWLDGSSMQKVPANSSFGDVSVAAVRAAVLSRSLSVCCFPFSCTDPCGLSCSFY